MNTKNAFEILQLAANATKQQAHDAYRKLAAKHHPDKNAEPMQIEKMQLINEAWMLLKDTLADSSATDEKKTRNKKTRTKAEPKARKAKPSHEGMIVGELRDNAFVITDENTAVCEGEFAVADLLDVLFRLSGQYITDVGDAVQNIDQLVKLFRGFATGRAIKVYSLALLDADNNCIRIEELHGDKITARDVAVQAVHHQASAVYVIQTTAADPRVTPAHRRKLNEITAGLETLGIACHDLVIVGNKMSNSVATQSQLEAA